jgi:ABC-type phosphate transport system substrate-binding protein
MIARLLSLLPLLLALASAPAAAEESGFRVIVHPTNAAETITRRQLSELFLKKTSQWPGGQAVHPVEPPENSRTRAYFLNDVMGKSAFAIKTFWNKRVFSGREVPPVEKPSDDAVVAYVRETPGAIGYVSASAPAEGVKVLELKD